ncbi:serine/threonine-protein kinase [Crocosphaera sp.]|uniref:serine/threonine protein kinase n=1 Tax=Crocosphaera sp. TaxID=2729996 RepID=UPI00261E40A0|nr:serine/threonine-protein kinase [Crocosphaera sp.]MDJ0581264.1 serine/threonine-protein kinase [Crocosphaera sp.]
MVWQTGQKLQGGKYEIIKVLGRGGFGITYHARHIKLNTEVVIKTPDLLQKKDIEYEQYVKQFQDEAQRLAKFSTKPHPHIVKVRDYFLEDTLPCLVMDFIRGQTLMEIIKTQGRLSEAQCLIYIRQIGKALETIHQAKMVHRDVHPGNIMIQDGEAILIDFGIARNIIPATQSITSNAANPSFAPYEQIYRGSKERQYTIDVYILAATFYYAVTAELPTPSMQRKLDKNSILLPPKQINNQLSEHINEVILEGMALEKEDRPQSISAWLGLLESSQPPPSVAPEYRKEQIKPKPKPKPKPPPPRSVNVRLPLWLAALTCIWKWAWELASAWELALLAFAWAFAWVWPSAFPLPLAWGLTGLLESALKKLKEKNFSRTHQFLILSGVSLSGIGLGYLIFSYFGDVLDVE